MNEFLSPFCNILMSEGDLVHVALRLAANKVALEDLQLLLKSVLGRFVGSPQLNNFELSPLR